ncbi:hypothetical protein AwDysgo_08290 [Bacteroidales bacterium]|nr:hypothetical protein AwDysgo_08290 [Bacteroidales bacterium]
MLEGQRSIVYKTDESMFFEAKAMFQDKNYAGCIDKLQEFKKNVRDANLMQETEFLLLSAAFRQGKEGVGMQLKDYLDKYTETNNYAEACFMIASTHFADKDFPLALYWLQKSEINLLPLQDQEDYTYRMAYSYLKTGDKDKAKLLFMGLRENGKIYKDASSFYLAYIYYTEKDYAKAIPLLSSLKDKSEFRLEVSYFLTQIHFVQGRYEQSINEGLSLLSNFPNSAHNTEIKRILGISYYQGGNFEDCTRYLNGSIQEDATTARADHYILGRSYFQLKNYEQSASNMAKAVGDNDELTQNALLYLAQSYLYVGDKNNAMRSFEAASRMNFDAQIRENAMYNYAVLLHQTSLSPFGESVIVLEEFLNTYTKSKYLDQINDCLVEVYMTTKNYDTALESISRIKNPGNKINEARQKIFFHLGTVYFSNAQFDEAIKNLTYAIEAGNYAPQEKNNALYWRAESYYRQAKYGASAGDYKLFLQRSTKKTDLNIAAYYGLAYSYFQQQEYEPATNNFSNYINAETNRDDVRYADAYARKGDCSFFMRRYTEADRAYLEAEKLQPSMGDYSLYQRGFMMGLQKNYKGKIQLMDELIKSYPDSRYITETLYEKGKAYLMLENDAAAIQTYEILANDYPQTDNARKAGIQLGLLYFNENQPEKSLNAYKKIVDTYPNSEEAKVAIQDLKSVYVELNDIPAYAQYINSLGGTAKFEVSEEDSLTFIVAERLFLKGGNASQAQNAMSKYLKDFPNGAFKINAHYYLASIYYNKKELSLAKTEYQKVLDSGDNKFTLDVLFRLSEIQFETKDYEASLKSYQQLQVRAVTLEQKHAALIGIMRCANVLNKPEAVIKSGDALLKEAKIDPEIKREAHYYRAKAYLANKNGAKALVDLQLLAKDTRDIFGAEAKFLLAEYYFSTNESAKAEAEVLDYIKKGTPHAYWLARSFILLSDVYLQKGDNLQARQYLESLQHNYKNDSDDISTMIDQRLEKLNE